MAEQLQFRRGTTAENAAFTGAVGEVTYDTQKKLLITHDGSTVGGFPGGGFLQSGAGAVPRTAEGKLKDIVSVKDFGAVGNGVADDTVALQAALDSGSQAILFPAGTYKITSSLSVATTKSLTIIGESAKIEAGTIMGHVLQVVVGAAIESVTVSGLVIDGQYVASTGIFIEADGGSVTRVTVENNIVQNFNNTTEVVSAFGIRVDALGAESVRVVGNTVKNVNRTQVNPGTIASVGIGVYSLVHGAVISGNHIENISSPAGDADADGVGVFSFNRLDDVHQSASPVITDNYFYNCKGRFVKSQCANMVVTNNRFEMAAFDCVDNFRFVDLQTGGGVISNNTGWWKPNIGTGTAAAFALITLRDFAVDDNQYIVSNNSIILNADLENFVFQWIPSTQVNPTHGTVKVSDNICSSEFDTYNLNDFLVATVDANTSFLDLVVNNNQIGHLQTGSLLRFYQTSLDPMSDAVTGPAIADILRVTLTNNTLTSDYPSTDLIQWETGDGGYPYMQHLMISGNTNFPRSEVICQGMDPALLPEGTSFYFSIDGTALGGLVNTPTNAPFNFARYVIVERPGEKFVRLTKYLGDGVAVYNTDGGASGYLYTSATALTF